MNYRHISDKNPRPLPFTDKGKYIFALFEMARFSNDKDPSSIPLISII